jgi:hypothetical protein
VLGYPGPPHVSVERDEIVRAADAHYEGGVTASPR